MLFRSVTSQAIYFFFVSNAFPDFGFVGRSVGKIKPKKKWRSLELGGLVPQHNNMQSLEMAKTLLKRKKDDKTSTVLQSKLTMF